MMHGRAAAIGQRRQGRSGRYDGNGLGRHGRALGLVFIFIEIGREFIFHAGKEAGLGRSGRPVLRCG